MTKLTIIIAYSLLVLLNLTNARSDKDEIKEKLVTTTKECQTEVAASDSDIEDMANRKPAAGKEGKCLRACVMKKFGMMDANGKFVLSAALEFAKKCANGDNDKLHKTIPVIEICAGLNLSKDDCEAAEQYKSCFFDKTKDMNVVW